MLFRDWQPAEGTVLASRPKPHWERWHANDPFPPMEYVIEYSFEESASQRVKLLEKRGKIIKPSIGDTVPLLVDRKSRKVKWDVKNPRLDARAAARAEEIARGSTLRSGRCLGPLRHIGDTQLQSA